MWWEPHSSWTEFARHTLRAGQFAASFPLNEPTSLRFRVVSYREGYETGFRETTHMPGLLFFL